VVQILLGIGEFFSSLLDAQDEEDFVITASVHVLNTPARTLNNRWPITLEKQHFEANEIVQCGNPEVDVMWAVHPLTDAPVISEELLDAQRRLTELINEWGSGNAP